MIPVAARPRQPAHLDPQDDPDVMGAIPKSGDEERLAG
jgi:hypothetical protein